MLLLSLLTQIYGLTQTQTENKKVAPQRIWGPFFSRRLKMGLKGVERAAFVSSTTRLSNNQLGRILAAAKARDGMFAP